MKLRAVFFSVFVFAFLVASGGWAPAAGAGSRPRGTQKAAAHYSLHPQERVQHAGALAWRPEAALPAGAESVVLEGDPAKPGLVVLRLKMPDGYRIPPVWHPAADRFTVISGTYHMGVGAKFDESKAVALHAGDFAWLSPAAPHFGWASGETVLEVVGLGPFVTNYVNPREDPRRR